MYPQIIEELTKAKYIRDTCKYAGDLSDDLFQFIWLRLLEMPKDKIEAIYKKGYLQFYICRMIINESRNKNNPFLRHMTLKSEPIIEYQIEEYDYKSDEEFETKLAYVKSKMENLFWYDKKIFELYLKFGSLRKVAAQTKIKYGSIHQTIVKVKRIINEK